MRAEAADDVFQEKREYFQEHGDAEGKVTCAITRTRITIEEAHH